MANRSRCPQREIERKAGRFRSSGRVTGYSSPTRFSKPSGSCKLAKSWVLSGWPTIQPELLTLNLNRNLCVSLAACFGGRQHFVSSWLLRCLRNHTPDLIRAKGRQTKEVRLRTSKSR